MAFNSQERPTLLRGQACVYCRRRKMRCDGVRPVCGQCARGDRSDECEYTDIQSRTRTEILEEEISRLQDRLYELEHPAENSEPIVLYQPYPEHLQSEVSALEQLVVTPGPLVSGTETLATILQEPPASMMPMLIDSFLENASELGFFLNPSRFRDSVLLSYPFGHPARPMPALLSTVYLWGIRILQPPSLVSQESEYLARALTQTATSLSGTHHQKVIHTIQAEILLASYFFSSGRLLEGQYHIGNALSLCISGGLNKIRSATLPSPSRSRTSFLLPPADSVEEGEQILACWTSEALDKCWAAALESSTNVIAETQVDTPWPLDIDEYEQGGHPVGVEYSLTVQRFLQGNSTPDTGKSTTALFAKASILWERATAIARRQMLDSSHLPSDSPLGLIDEFLSSLTPLRAIENSTPAKVLRLLETHCMTHAALIRLLEMDIYHSTENTQRRIASAEFILRSVCSIELREHGRIIVNPIMAIVWSLASMLLVDDLKHSESAELIRTKMDMLQRSLFVMKSFSQGCVLTKYEIYKVEEALKMIEKNQGRQLD